MPDHVIGIALSVQPDGYMLTDCAYNIPDSIPVVVGTFIGRILGMKNAVGDLEPVPEDTKLRVLLSREDSPQDRILVVVGTTPWPADAQALATHDILRHSKAVEAEKEQRPTTGYRRRSEYRHAAYARMRAWAVIQLLELGVPEDVLLRSRGWVRSFALRPGPLPGQAFYPGPRSLVPFQRAHYSPLAIPREDANRLCASMNADDLLSALTTLGTDYDMYPALQECLLHFLKTSPDFGYVYGVLRPYWNAIDALPKLPDVLFYQEGRVRRMRREAVTDNYLTDVRVPPRRLWDLYSNRVLPYHVLPCAPFRFPYNFWTVSHSWVDDDARMQVITPVNGRAWPVPIPRGTSLSHIRIELLNFGAEYVWLDVLCLRQVGQPEDEKLREEEWKLDIPTIGFIYSLRDVPCVTYFNGLGLPFDPSERALSSKRHWLKRVWTVQETTDNWLPGGTTARSSACARSFFHDHHTRSILPNFDPLSGTPSTLVLRLTRAVKELSARHCTSELDRVSSLAYILGCKTRPLYDTSVSADRAWAILLKHLPGIVRAQIALRSMQRGPQRREVLPTWQEFLGDFATWDVEEDVLRRMGNQYTPLRLVDSSSLGAVEPGVYYEDVHLVGPLTVLSEAHIDGATALDVLVKDQDFFRFQWERKRRFLNVMGGHFDLDGMYMFRQTRLKVTIILQVLGKRFFGGYAAFVVAKRGAILEDYNSASFSYAPLHTVAAKREKARTVLNVYSESARPRLDHSTLHRMHRIY